MSGMCAMHPTFPPHMHTPWPDSRVVRKFVARMLERAGYSVDFAADGHKALTLMKKQFYDCVFMDLDMPVMTGGACAEALRGWEATIERCVCVGVCVRVCVFWGGGVRACAYVCVRVCACISRALVRHLDPTIPYPLPSPLPSPLP